VVICLERVADLHITQLMPLPLTVSCFSKIQIGFTFLVLAHAGSPDKGPLNGCVCVLCCSPLNVIRFFSQFVILLALVCFIFFGVLPVWQIKIDTLLNYALRF